MTEFTIQRGSDGFGSQMMAILTGYLIGCDKGHRYLYSTIRSIELCIIGAQNQELDEMNRILSAMMSNLGVERAAKNTPNIFVAHCKLPHLCTNTTFQGEGLEKLKVCWPLEPTSDKKTLSIHIRMGDDVEVDNRVRCQPIEYYNNLIRRCLERFPDHTIQLISWREPAIAEDLKDKVVVDASESSDVLRHYNLMIHSDILIIGSSSLSMSAGLLNPNTVLCDKDIIAISPQYPKQWNDQFEELLG